MATLSFIAICTICFIDAPHGWALAPTAFDSGTLVSHLFLHVSWSHFACNMVMLLVFGLIHEHRHGHWSTIGLFLGAGILSALAEVYSNPTFPGVIMGASGAIFALVGAYSLHNRAAWLVAVPTFLWLSFEALQETQDPSTSHIAHLAGFIIGAFYAIWKADREPIPETV